MKNFITTLISALIAAVIVTELYTRVWPDTRLALFLLTFIAIAAVSLYNVRLAAVRLAAGAAGASRAAGASATQNTGGRPPRNNRGKGNADKGGNAKNNAGGRNANRPAKANANANANADNRGEKSAPRPATPVPDGPRESGSVKWFNRSKGFGFIIRDNGEEIFVHHRSIRNSDDSRRANLRDGQKVSFVVADHDKGQQAEDVVGE